MLETAETRWGPQAARKFRRGLPPPAYLLAAKLYTGPRDLPYTDPAGQASEPVVSVRVNHGVWQAQCPFCPSAQHASSDGLFYCAQCLNAPAGHKTVPQVWPRNPAAIETKLCCRPVENRNWEPGETVAHLARENKEHGL